jgi:hypothetical protein
VVQLTCWARATGDWSPIPPPPTHTQLSLAVQRAVRTHNRQAKPESTQQSIKQTLSINNTRLVTNRCQFQILYVHQASSYRYQITLLLFDFSNSQVPNRVLHLTHYILPYLNINSILVKIKDSSLKNCTSLSFSLHNCHVSCFDSWRSWKCVFSLASRKPWAFYPMDTTES